MNKTTEKYNLTRFLRRQEKDYKAAYEGICEGKMITPYMCSTLPCLRSLAQSRKAFVYGLVDLGEARAYLEHEVLGPRLRDCCKAILSHKEASGRELFGGVGLRKLRASMTLFSMAADDSLLFDEVLDRFCDGKKDERTYDLVRGKIIDIAHLKYIKAFIN